MACWSISQRFPLKTQPFLCFLLVAFHLLSDNVVFSSNCGNAITKDHFKALEELIGNQLIEDDCKRKLILPKRGTLDEVCFIKGKLYEYKLFLTQLKFGYSSSSWKNAKTLNKMLDDLFSECITATEIETCTETVEKSIQEHLNDFKTCLENYQTLLQNNTKDLKCDELYEPCNLPEPEVTENTITGSTAATTCECSCPSQSTVSSRHHPTIIRTSKETPVLSMSKRAPTSSAPLHSERADFQHSTPIHIKGPTVIVTTQGPAQATHRSSSNEDEASGTSTSLQNFRKVTEGNWPNFDSSIKMSTSDSDMNSKDPNDISGNAVSTQATATSKAPSTYWSSLTTGVSQTLSSTNKNVFHCNPNPTVAQQNDRTRPNADSSAEISVSAMERDIKASDVLTATARNIDFTQVTESTLAPNEKQFTVTNRNSQTLPKINEKDFDLSHTSTASQPNDETTHSRGRNEVQGSTGTVLSSTIFVHPNIKQQLVKFDSVDPTTTHPEQTSQTHNPVLDLLAKTQSAHNVANLEIFPESKSNNPVVLKDVPHSQPSPIAEGTVLQTTTMTTPPLQEGSNIKTSPIRSQTFVFPLAHEVSSTSNDPIRSNNFAKRFNPKNEPFAETQSTVVSEKPLRIKSQTINNDRLISKIFTPAKLKGGSAGVGNALNPSLLAGHKNDAGSTDTTSVENGSPTSHQKVGQGISVTNTILLVCSGCVVIVLLAYITHLKRESWKLNQTLMHRGSETEMCELNVEEE
ncbi:uncharacterized protein LOC102356247 isoform X2 [Latimeria chalumnae]|uniref:uncharacterized protein LOC102356247 isoform X2 n=1 Tax=Latimeria chalumnae TaxID=7897 RepID=UPI00313A8561